MSEEAKAKRQGHTFRVTTGPFAGRTGVLQATAQGMGRLAWPGRDDDLGHENNVVRLWFAWECIEEVRGGA